MKIKITDKACGLEVGKEYDLCDMAAKGLIQKRQAVAVKDIVIEKPIAKEPEKPAQKIDPEMLKCKKQNLKAKKGKTNESNTE
jgi:hypothetical protein